MGPMIDELAGKERKERKPVEKDPQSEARQESRKIEVAHQEPDPSVKKVKMKGEGICAWFGTKQALFDVNIGIDEKAVTAIIGPSG